MKKLLLMSPLMLLVGCGGFDGFGSGTGGGNGGGFSLFGPREPEVVTLNVVTYDQRSCEELAELSVQEREFLVSLPVEADPQIRATTLRLQQIAMAREAKTCA